MCNENKPPKLSDCQMKFMSKRIIRIQLSQKHLRVFLKSCSECIPGVLRRGFGPSSVWAAKIGNITCRT